jgi:hypothetical protein
MKPARLTSFQGMSLCSQRDPQREAATWCEAVQSKKSEDQYWVLGLGAGYHIEELARRNPKTVICVVEFRKELIELFWAQAPHLKGQVLITHIDRSSNIFHTQVFEIFGLSLAPIFKFFPALQGFEAQAQEVEEHLSGRTPEGFAFFAHHFGFGLEEKLERVQSLDVFNIKTIDSLFDGIGSTRQKKLVSFLKELVR